MTQTLKLRPREDKRLRGGHVWIYSNEVDTASTPLKGFEAGEEAVVLSDSGRPLGRALVNPHALICARLVSRDPDVGLDRALPRGTERGAVIEHGTKQRHPHISLCSHVAGIALPALGARAIAADARAMAGAMRRARVHVASRAAPARPARALAPRAHARSLDPNGRALDAPAVP